MLARRFGCTFSSEFVTFLKTCTKLPSLSTIVLTNSYPGTFPASLVPFSDGLSGFPFSSTHIVVLLSSGIRLTGLKM